MTPVVEAQASAKRAPALRGTSSFAHTKSASRRRLPQAHRRGETFRPSLAGFPLVSCGVLEGGERLADTFKAVPGWKRVLDVLCILISLPVTLPVMAAVAMWIRLASRGPALFRQERIGRGGRKFVIYKFRSMKMHADTRRHARHFRNLVRSNSPMVKLDLMCDTRLIYGGCLLRAAGLDELPQLINILRGEMSLVGPRPCLPEEFRFFSLKQRERFDALPGLTGIWQVNGKGASTFTEMNEMDARYVRESSPMVDVGIMLRTPIALMRQMHQALVHQITACTESPHSDDSGIRPVSGMNTQRFG
jgi:lipopolysaccharide/colanic/teichoic acid biosynthesis glycosyltransferase